MSPPVSRPALAGALAAGLALGLVLLALAPDGTALPEYAARSARTCDNCHVDPSRWTDPPLLDRKCSLDCSVCHVDPTGGGLRTVAGYYFGIQTLPMFGASRQPWADRHVELTPSGTAHLEWASGEAFPAPETPAAGASPAEEPTSQPTSQPSEASLAAQESGFRIAAFGTPAGPRATNAPLQGRYGSLLADPLFRFGFDMRLAFYAPQNSFLFFPMQTDLEVAVHPVEHLTMMVEGGLQGSRTSTAGGTVGGQEVNLFGLHEAFLMTHEWPGNAYLKVGRFLPPFGWRLDDHTAPVRRLLGLDQGQPSSYVSGVEIGGVANYPFFNLAAFRLDAGQYGFWPSPDTGSGLSGMTGWRDLSWGLSGSVFASSSDAEDRRMVGLSWYLNPWRWWSKVPLTYLGEADLAVVQPAGRSRTIDRIAVFHELDWRLVPGVQLRLRYDFADPDTDVVNDAWHRLNLDVDFFPYRYTEVEAVARLILPEAGSDQGDFLFVLRGWY